MSEKTGLDLMNWQFDYTKTKEENDEVYRQAYREAYDEEPPMLPSEDDFEKRLKNAKK